MGTSKLCALMDDVAVTLQHHMHNHSLANDNGRDIIAIRLVVIMEEMKCLTYQFTFHTTEELLSTLADEYSTSLYVWGSQAVMYCLHEKPPRPPFQVQSCCRMTKAR